MTVIDKAGHRFPMRGLEGQTLVEVLSNQDALDVHDCAPLGIASCDAGATCDRMLWQSRSNC